MIPLLDLLVTVLQHSLPWIGLRRPVGTMMMVLPKRVVVSVAMVFLTQLLLAKNHNVSGRMIMNDRPSAPPRSSVSSTNNDDDIAFFCPVVLLGASTLPAAAAAVAPPRPQLPAYRMMAQSSLLREQRNHRGDEDVLVLRTRTRRSKKRSRMIGLHREIFLAAALLRGGGDDDDAGDHGSAAAAAATTTTIAAPTVAVAKEEQEDEPEAIMILRVRSPNGSLQRLKLTSEIQKMTIAELLQSLGHHHPVVLETSSTKKKASRTARTTPAVQLDGTDVASLESLVSELPNIQHGSLLTILQSSIAKDKKEEPAKTKKSATANGNSKTNNGVFDEEEDDKNGTDDSSFVPFPDLAKRWNDRRYRATNNNKPTSYAALSAYRDATVHRIDEVSQPKRIEQVYICPAIARRFVDTAADDESSSPSPSSLSSDGALILGTIGRQHKTKPRHSLDDNTHKSTLIAKSHALVMPAEEKDDVWKDVAAYLGLQVIGWMVASTANDDGALWPTNNDILRAARYQINVMRKAHQQQGMTPFEGFCTIAMDRSSGATEVYQLTDVTVQMAAEGLFHDIKPNNNDNTGRTTATTTESPPPDQLTTKHPIWVDGGESTSLDTLLCLVNTAVVSQTGWYTKVKRTVKKNNGRLTKATRTKLLAALLQDNSNDDAVALDLLCDFDLLVVLVRMLRQRPGQLLPEDDDGRELCQTVQQFAKGRKRTTKLNPALRQRIADLIQSAAA
jgi:hypothetical protein